MPTFKLPSGGILTGTVRVFGKEQVEAKLARAEANILANNRAMVGEMLGFVKAEVVPQIPIGPGHFGYHLRETFRSDIKTGRGQLGAQQALYQFLLRNGQMVAPLTTAEEQSHDNENDEDADHD